MLAMPASPCTPPNRFDGTPPIDEQLSSNILDVAMRPATACLPRSSAESQCVIAGELGQTSPEQTKGGSRSGAHLYFLLPRCAPADLMLRQSERLVSCATARCSGDGS